MDHDPIPVEMPSDPLFQLLQPERRTAVVDIGANPIDGMPPYHPMLQAGLCSVLGFEPQQQALENLRHLKGPLETYLPHAIGDGSLQTLYHCAEPGMTSLLEPDEHSLSLFPLFSEFAQVTATERIPTRTLDSVEEIHHLDFLKMDVQGAELTILRNARRALANAVAIQAEVSFLPLYKGQPSFGDIDAELRSQGFIPHMFVDVKRWVLAPLVVNNNPRQALNQVVEADAVYVRDFRRPELFTSEQWKHLALIAHHCFNSYDLAFRCILAASQGNQEVSDRYLALLASKDC